MSETCEDIEVLLSGYVDNELDASDRDRVDAHVAQCTRCRNELDAIRGVATATESLSAPSVDDEIWDGFLDNVYNRLERRLGWTLLMLGSVLVGGFLTYEAIVLPWASPVVKVALATPLAGVGLLFGSVLRQRLHVARTDRYSRDVRR